MKTRLGLIGITRGLYGSFAGKTQEIGTLIPIIAYHFNHNVGSRL